MLLALLWSAPDFIWRLAEKLTGVTEDDLYELFNPLTDRNEDTP